MRNLALRLILWLARRYGVVLLNEQRRHISPDAIVRAKRWEEFYNETGGLADMLAALRREAFEAAAELDPKDTDKIYYWATADRNLRRLDHKVLQVIASGKTLQMQNDEKDRLNSFRVVKSV